MARARLRGVAAAAALLAFSLTPFVLQWDASVLSESVSLSAVALIFAAVLWLTRRFTWVRASLLIGACLMFELARDEGIVSVAALGVGIGIIAIIHGARHRSEIALRCAIVAVLILVMAMSVELAATHTHRNALNVEHSLFVRVFPSPNAVAWFSAHGMPQAAAIDLAADAAKVGDAFQDTYLLPKPTPQTAEVVSLVISTHYWKPLRDWISTSGESAYLRYLLSHPGFVVSAPFHRPSLAFNSPSSIAFYQIHGHHFVPGLSVLFPRRVFVLAMALLAAVLMAIKRIWRRREVLFLSLMVPLGFFTMAVGWFGDGEEVARHMIEGNVMVRLAVLLLFLWAIFGRVSPRVTEDVSL